jgi:lysozyme
MSLLNPAQREKLRKELKVSEGTGPVKKGRMFPYRDTKGYLTIGVGRNLDAKGISPEEADHLLDNDITEAEDALARALPWVKDLDDARRRVLVDMAFNMGVGDLKGGLLSFKHTLEAIRTHQWEKAAAGMEASKWYRDVGPRRADPLIERILTGEDK